MNNKFILTSNRFKKKISIDLSFVNSSYCQNKNSLSNVVTNDISIILPSHKVIYVKNHLNLSKIHDILVGIFIEPSEDNKQCAKILRSFCVPVISKLSLDNCFFFSDKTIEEHVNFIANLPLISVIVPMYNSSCTIKHSIDSAIIFQYYKNVELIVINDNSTDNSLAVAQTSVSQHNNSVIITNSVNRGAYYSRNVGLQIHKGNFWCILDSDDVMHPNKLFTDYLQLYKNPSKLVSLSILVRIEKKSGYIVSINFNAPNSMLLSRKIFDILGYFPNTRFQGDIEYYDRIIKYLPDTILFNSNIGYIAYYTNNTHLTKLYGREAREIYKKKYTEEIASGTKYRNFWC